MSSGLQSVSRSRIGGEMITVKASNQFVRLACVLPMLFSLFVSPVGAQPEASTEHDNQVIADS